MIGVFRNTKLQIPGFPAM